MEQNPFTTFQPSLTLEESAMAESAKAYYDFAARRRSIRKFSDRPIPLEVIQNCIMAAGTAPSGANKQPWFFSIVKSEATKKRIRIAAEEEEHLFYSKRASQNWLNDLKPFRTNSHKPYLEKAPYLIAIFFKLFEDANDRQTSKCYYPKESVGIATGILINALHNCGLVSLTHTPSPMDFLNEELQLCKKQYRPFLLLVTGFPETDAEVPVLKKKDFDEIARVY